MFAGPNGSGKSRLKSALPLPLLGVFVGPDEIEDEIRRTGFLDFTPFNISPRPDEVIPFFAASSFLKSAGLGNVAQKLTFSANKLGFGGVRVDSYFASATADFVRQKLLSQRLSFTFETVMSHPDKVALLARAQVIGYRTYLYFVATDDPAINVSRVQNRVALGGHAVPEAKIAPRYHRSLDLLMDAIRHSHRAYIFDNSTDNADRKHTWLAEITNGRTLELKTNLMPAWFRHAVLDKIE